MSDVPNHWRCPDCGASHAPPRCARNRNDVAAPKPPGVTFPIDLPREPTPVDLALAAEAQS